MTRLREIWFERVYSTPRVTWWPVHRNGWIAVAALTVGFISLLSAAIALPALGADPGWTLAIMVASCVLAAGFLLVVRGRIR